jgi:hypothetical protein
MAGSFSDYLEMQILKWAFTTDAVTRPTAWYVALFSTAEGDAAGGTELTGAGGYARQSIGSMACTGTTAPQAANQAIVTFGPATGADWATATHFAIMDAPTGGNELAWGQLPVSKTVQVGDSAAYAIAALVASLD